MLKAVQRNSLLYKNTNNIGFIYEFLGNNSFSNEDLFELGDFLHQNDIMIEYFVLNYGGVKKYYVSFFLGEIGYANNYSNYKGDLFYSRYHQILNLKPKIEDLSMFKGGKIKEVDLKLYNLTKKETGLSNRDKLLKTLGYDKEKVRNYLLGENYGLFLENLLLGREDDYQKFLYDKMYIKNLNFDFYNTDQEIFDATLNFLTGSKFFVFPFYLKGKNNRVGDISYQELDFNTVMSGFLDNNVIKGPQDKGKDLVGYLYKVSIKPTLSVSVDKEKNKVTYAGIASEFDLKSIGDNKNMFFEYQHSMFLYTKRPDIQKLIGGFTEKFQTAIELDTVAFPRDFNPQYLSHNRFGAAYHVGHLQNNHNILSTLKEYYPPMKNGMQLGKEYFSSNEFKVNIFDLAGKDKNGNLITSCNMILYGNTGAGKTFFTTNKIWNQNTVDQLIVFDNLDNFSKEYHNMSEGPEKDKINLFEYGEDFPNIIGKITNNNISHKQEILLSIILGPKSEMDDSNKTIITAMINKYLTTIKGNSFKLSLFEKWVKLSNESYVSEGQKQLLIGKLNAVNETLKRILNNDKSFDVEIYKKQKVIFSYSHLTDSTDKDNTYFTLSLLLRLVRGYLSIKSKLPADKVNYRYTMILYDEAHNVMGKNKTLDNDIKEFMKEMRNRKAQMTLLTQNYEDIPSHLRFLVKIFILLDPDNYDEFKTEKSHTEEVDKTSLDRTFYNFAPALKGIVSKYRQDEGKVKDGLMKESDRTRFCVFANLISDSLYILDTR